MIVDHVVGVRFPVGALALRMVPCGVHVNNVFMAYGVIGEHDRLLPDCSRFESWWASA